VDAILQSSLLSELSPFAIGFMALVFCYFLWQRQTEQYNDLLGRITDIMKAQEKSDSEIRAANQAMASQNTAFQLEISGSRPSRAEMNESLDRITTSVRDMIAPVRDDLKTIKETLLRGKVGGT
jgi:nitrogen fixation-related uncharacterized protein